MARIPIAVISSIMVKPRLGVGSWELGARRNALGMLLRFAGRRKEKLR